ncbi:MAG: cell division protein ZapA [Gammaproteobacteria bacterium]|nr:cell division protein ZapA [Gammaproteobacteria bacterium]
MDNNKKKTVLDINILGKEYKIGCLPDHQNSLIKAAQYLDSKMREFRDQYQIVGLDKIAVLTALHISHDLLNQSGNNNSNINSNSNLQINDKLQELNEKVLAALNETEDSLQEI